MTHISADGARWLTDVIDSREPDAVLCTDPFYVVRWAVGALDEGRREVRREVRTRRGHNRPAVGESGRLKDARWAL